MIVKPVERPLRLQEVSGAGHQGVDNLKAKGGPLSLGEAQAEAAAGTLDPQAEAKPISIENPQTVQDASKAKTLNPQVLVQPIRPCHSKI